MTINQNNLFQGITLSHNYVYKNVRPEAEHVTYQARMPLGLGLSPS